MRRSSPRGELGGAVLLDMRPHRPLPGFQRASWHLLTKVDLLFGETVASLIIFGPNPGSD